MSYPQVCKNCRKAPVHPGFEFCGKQCGQAYKQNQSQGDTGSFGYGGGMNSTGGGGYSNSGGMSYGTPRGPRNMNLCDYCGTYPKNPPHEYCSRACGQAALSGGQQTSTRGPGPAQTRPRGNPCGIPGCNADAHQGSKYCGNPHREQAVKQGLEPPCLMCKKYPCIDAKSHFCGRVCQENATAAATTLLEVPTGDPRFASVAGQFATAWKHTPKAPRVVRVYKIVLPKSALDRYEAYKQSVEARGKFSKRGMEVGNERRRWHGTTRKCTLGDDPKNLKMCGQNGCSLCAILGNSYDVKYAAIGGMFGPGIYFSATSSKSDGYVSSAGPYRAMFLNRVVVGKGHILTTAQNSLRAPPAGHDSVIANAGQALKNDELIVYNNDACRTSWLLIYDKNS